MSNKLTFDEWFKKQNKSRRKDQQVSRLSVMGSCWEEGWNAYQAQEQKEIEELKKKVEELEKTVSSQTEIIYKLENECSFTYKCPVNSNLQKENESLKKKLEKAEEVIQFYGGKENWLFTGMYCNTGKHKITDRMQAINGWHDQHKSIVNSDIENHSDYLMFGGKRARAYLKENEG